MNPPPRELFSRLHESVDMVYKRKSGSWDQQRRVHAASGGIAVVILASPGAG